MCPEDMDVYWNEAKGLLNGHDYKVEIVEVETGFQNVECYDLFFIGVDGSRIYAKYLKPLSHVNGKMILQFHGYMYYSGEWSEKLAYVSQGYSVIAMDCRGQGGRSQDFSACEGTTIYGHVIKGVEDCKEKIYYKNVFLDTFSIANIAFNMEGIEEVYAMGLSQGGGLALACASLCPEVSKVAVQNPFLSDYKKTWEMQASRENYRIADYFRFFDPLHEKEDEVFEKLGYIDVHNLVDKIKGKVLFGIGEKDVVCPIYTQMAIYNNLQCEKELLLYPDFEHETLPFFWDKAIKFFNETTN